MSRECRIHVKPGAMPTAADLQRALTSQGFKLDLEGLDLARARGFHGCVLDGEDAGFSVAHDGEVLCLRWSGDPREHCAALMVAAALHRLTGAAVRVGAGEPVPASELAARIAELTDAL